MPAEEMKLPVPIINRTRYYTDELEAMVGPLLRKRFRGPIVFEAFDLRDPADFYGDPLLVKFDRLKKDVEGVLVRVVTPTRTGKAFTHPAVHELELLACMHEHAAPLCLRRQILLRVGMSNACRSYYYRHSYTQKDIWPNPPELHFHLKDRAPEDIAWQEKRVEAVQAVLNTRVSLASAHSSIRFYTDQIEKYRRNLASTQADLETAVKSVGASEQALTRLALTRPSDH